VKFIIKILIIFAICSLQIFTQKKEIIAYFGGYHSAHSGFLVKDVEKRGVADKITVINYAFATPWPDSSGNIIPQINPYFAYQEVYSGEMSVDGIADDSTQSLRGNFNQLKKLKLKFPDIKILLSIGGYGGSKYFSDLALTGESRKKFVDECIDIFIRGNLPLVDNAGGSGSGKNIFDGFDLDWEFPVSGGPEGTHYNPNDRENQTALFTLFRKKLDAINPDLLLTTAVSARSWEFWKYNFNRDQKYLDWFNVMTYDYHGSWESVTGHHTNLLSSQFDPDDNRESMDYTVKYLLDSAKVDKNKIAPGAAFYGKGWMNVDSTNFGLYQQGNPDTSRSRIRFSNYMDFSDIKQKGYNCYWDSNAMAAWLYNPVKKKFWTYDDIRSVVLKARYVDAYDLRGLMFWAIGGDDTSATLIKSIYNRNMPDIKTNNDNEENNLAAIVIARPKNFDNFTEHSNVVIETNIKNAKGEIAKVEFFVDDNSIGYNRIAPFGWVWFNALPGKHKIKVVAKDSAGGDSDSEYVEINVIKSDKND